MTKTKHKLVILFVVTFLAASFINLSEPSCYDKIVPENLSVLQEECPDVFENLMFCVADHVECLKKSDKVAECNFEFFKCAEVSRNKGLSSVCNKFLSDGVDHIRKNGAKCLEEKIDAAIREIEDSLSPITAILHNSTKICSLVTKGRNVPCRLPDIIGLFVPMFRDSSLIYREDAEQLAVALRSVEQRTFKTLGIPFALWYGGLGHKVKALGKVFDRILVSTCCGHSVAQKINHAWARCADCLATSKSFNCTGQLIRTLEEAALESTKAKTICMMYVGSMKLFTFLIVKSSYTGHLFEYVDAESVLQEESNVEILRNTHFSLLKLIGSDSGLYRKCPSVKRTVSSCEFSYVDCEHRSKSDCFDKLSNCHLNILDADATCTKALVYKRNILEVVSAWFWYFIKNPLVVLLAVVAFLVAAYKYITCFCEAKRKSAKAVERMRCWFKKTDEDVVEICGDPLILSAEEIGIGGNNNNNNNNNTNGDEVQQENEDKKQVRFWSQEFWRQYWDRFIAWLH